MFFIAETSCVNSHANRTGLRANDCATHIGTLRL